jgi:hypothetical protein
LELVRPIVVVSPSAAGKGVLVSHSLTARHTEPEKKTKKEKETRKITARK